ncbi:MAG: TadE/TadG family type IV pilus assembly protein [Chloroflexota bacterium]
MCDERGQAAVEFGIIGTVFFILSIGLIDAGRGFYQYNALSSVARDAARWGSVIGGTCLQPASASTSDFCNQLGGQSGTVFWSQQGNVPIQGAGTDCPTYSTTPGDYYAVGTYASSSSSTVVGAIAHRFDSDSGSSSVITGSRAPGFDWSQLKACVALLGSGSNPPKPGDTVKVALYYPFKAVGPLLPGGTLPLTASSQFPVE